ncbi:MAG: hypothetical protein IPK17_13830 [Chloroflexi bacterium]|uniref:hypothetical protein n=1 Tax=Candidatus Flexifilum breve TaxID=3140694 RepID=UPI00313543A4|nr:hypothetical protein [Chloroflexota bacterium]
MSQTPVMLAMPEPPEPENIVKRLFKIAEILSRTPTRQNDDCFDDKNGFKIETIWKSGILIAATIC